MGNLAHSTLDNSASERSFSGAACQAHIDFVDAREPAVRRCMAWLLRIYRRINM